MMYIQLFLAFFQETARQRNINVSYFVFISLKCKTIHNQGQLSNFGQIMHLVCS
jgi:hypothetical protein